MATEKLELEKKIQKTPKLLKTKKNTLSDPLDASTYDPWRQYKRHPFGASTYHPHLWNLGVCLI
jgi:hypothetical protein